MNVEQLQEGVLVSIKIKRWNASVKIDPSMISEKAPSEILRTMQDMIGDKSILQMLTSVRNKTKYILRSNTISFPIENIWFVPKNKIEELNESFKKCQRDYALLTGELCEKYDKLKRDFKKQYPKYFRIIESKYPEVSELRDKFSFSWNFFQFTIPGEKADILPPSIYKREQRKFQNLIKEMEQNTTNMVGQLLLQRVSKLQEQCQDGSVNMATINSIDGFLQKWNDLWEGHCDNKKLQNIIEQVKKHMKKTSTETLKTNQTIMDETGDVLKKIINSLGNISSLDLKRKIDF